MYNRALAGTVKSVFSNLNKKELDSGGSTSRVDNNDNKLWK